MLPPNRYGSTLLMTLKVVSLRACAAPLVIAGAETVVMSLWKVNDDSTRLLMNSYYRNLLAGQGRSSALREAMRSFRATHPDSHPHDWAPFIALGSDAPLRDIAPSPPRSEAHGAAP
jgi:hypothetical protein